MRDMLDKRTRDQLPSVKVAIAKNRPLIAGFGRHRHYDRFGKVFSIVPAFAHGAVRALNRRAGHATYCYHATARTRLYDWASDDNLLSVSSPWRDVHTATDIAR
jgi:hypothetical protein